MFSVCVSAEAAATRDDPVQAVVLRNPDEAQAVVPRNPDAVQAARKRAAAAFHDDADDAPIRDAPGRNARVLHAHDAPTFCARGVLCRFHDPK